MMWWVSPQSGREGEAPWALPTEGATRAPKEAESQKTLELKPDKLAELGL
ncbi:MAG: hypothetical protein Q8P84_05355 [Deltaproteobacteria bacterium]|nr:hypothetical protein [Deltaproteobacteria bacterium]